MESIQKLMKDHGIIIKLVAAILLFVLAGFCPLVEFKGETANGFKILFDGTGMGFTRFVCFFVICAPAATALVTAVKSIEDRLTLIGFAISFAAIVVFWLSLPKLIGLAAGGVLYIIFALAALILNGIEVSGDPEAKNRKSGLV